MLDVLTGFFQILILRCCRFGSHGGTVFRRSAACRRHRIAATAGGLQKRLNQTRHFSCILLRQRTADDPLNILHRGALRQEFSDQERQAFVLLHQRGTTEHHGAHRAATLFLRQFLKKAVGYPVRRIALRVDIKRALTVISHTQPFIATIPRTRSNCGLSLTKKRSSLTPVACFTAPATRLAPPPTTMTCVKPAKRPTESVTRCVRAFSRSCSTFITWARWSAFWR
uniref:ParB n=1 Tax=Klebsiella pneumoniae TaxID=573 RepID=R9R757_KLEPN|nr:ParB [Klebsiella pneumoniae]AGL13159.1 ParB [Klebsiella pneumoniae]